MTSSGSSFWMIAMSRLIVSGVSDGKAEDISRQRDDALRLPGEQHLAVLGDLVLALLRRGEIVRIDVLQSDEDARDAGPLRLLHEIRDLVAQRIDLDHQAERDAVLLPQLDQAVEDLLPFSVEQIDLTEPVTNSTITYCSHAKRNPADEPQPRIGEEIAAARALADLTHQLLDKAAGEISAVTHRSATISV